MRIYQNIILYKESAENPWNTPSKIANIFLNRFVIDEDLACEIIGTYILSNNDTDIQLKVSQVFNSLNFTPWPTIWRLQCCRFPTCCCKLQNVWTEHYWMRTKGECGFAELGADPAMISNWNRSILNSAIDDHWSHTERIVQVLVNFIHLLIR